MKTIDNIVVIDRYDYDELVEKATLTEDKINLRAGEISANRDTIPVRIEFNQYRNRKNFSAPIGFVRHGFNNEKWEILNEIEPKVKEWLDENMSMYDKALRERNITERNCVALSKQVSNLTDKVRSYKLKMTAFWIYAIVITVITFALINLQL